MLRIKNIIKCLSVGVLYIFLSQLVLGMFKWIGESVNMIFISSGWSIIGLFISSCIMAAIALVIIFLMGALPYSFYYALEELEKRNKK